MRYAVALSLALCLFSAHAAAQEDPCAGVGCSGAGVCAVSELGDPVCVCNEGYAPDETGLSCLASVTGAPPAQPPAEQAAPGACPTAEEVLLQINKVKAIKQLVVWPIFFALGTGVLVAGAVLYDKDSKLWPLHLAMLVTGGFIAAASALIVGIYAARLARINKRLRQCRGLACIDLGEDTQVAFHPTGLALTF